MNFQDPYVITGIVGMLCIVFGLYRTSSGRWKNSSPLYELDTILGASLLVVYQIHVKAYVAIPINLMLVFVSFRGLSSFAERYTKKVSRTKTRSAKKR
ncbi:MAG: hypothetical protein WCO19_00055 [Candidatus Saccharibacteria bacterium]